jgi:hypothetical protein
MKRNILFLILAGIITYIATTGSGCETNPSGPTTITDTNVKVYTGLVITGYLDSTSMSGINLLNGLIVPSNSGQKDLLLKDFEGTNHDWYLRSGSKSVVDDPSLLGFETRFKVVREYLDLSKAQFDTISKIKNVGSSLNLGDFSVAQTNDYADNRYFNPGTEFTNRMVYSFYLKGRKESGNTVHSVWGLIHLESFVVEGNERRLKVNVKINTRGENQFLRERTITAIE